MFTILIESIGVSAILLSLIYYIIPELMMGRGILAISLVFFFNYRLFLADHLPQVI